jgi:hypothetical protein
MHRRPGRAGRSTRDMADRRHRLAWLSLLLMLGAAGLMFLGIANAGSLGIVGVLLVLVLGQLLFDRYEADGLRTLDERDRANRGAVAEERIGSSLDDLGEDYLVLHDIRSAYGNVDHIAICKTGSVFLIETKSHPGHVSVVNGQLLVNGHEPEKDFIAQAINNTFWLKKRIREAIGVDVWVTSVIVFTKAFVERGTVLRTVTVVNQRYLSDVLHGQNSGTKRLPVWENRARIREALLAG